MGIAISLILISVIPAALIYTLAILEPFAMTRRTLIGASVVWGIVSYFLADTIQSYELNTLQTYNLSVALVSAPLLEEFLKIAFLFVIYNRTLARYSGDGLVYGFAVGSGFGMAENLAYVMGQPDQALGISLARIVSTGLFHASMAGILGAVICGVIYYRRSYTYIVFALLFLFAVAAHHYVNLIALLELYVGDITPSILIGIGSLFVVFAILYLIRFREKRRITHSIPDNLNDTELMVMHHGATLLDDLDKQASQFNPGEVDLLRDYLLKEAQVAWMTHRVITGWGKRKNIVQLRTELSDLREKIRVLKRQFSPVALQWLKEERRMRVNQ